MFRSLVFPLYILAIAVGISYAANITVLPAVKQFEATQRRKCDAMNEVTPGSCLYPGLSDKVNK